MKKVLLISFCFLLFFKFHALGFLPSAEINRFYHPAKENYSSPLNRTSSNNSVIPALRQKATFRCPDPTVHLLSTDTIIVGLQQDDTLRITGNWTHTGPIWVFNNGVLIFDHATVVDTGDIFIWGHGQLIADSSSLTFPQQYFYERSLLAVGQSSITIRNCSMNYSGMSHNLFLTDTATAVYTNIHQNDWTTCGLWKQASLTVHGMNLAGEYILSDQSVSQFVGADSLILWHQLPSTTMMNFHFPTTDTTYQYEFHNGVTGVAGLNYSVTADSCTHVMWALMPVNGSVVTINNSIIRAIGCWFINSDTVNAVNISNNNYYLNYTVPLSDRNLHIINSAVQTWSLYVFDSSEVNIYGGQLGEVGTQGHARVNSSSFILDGSGGYFWATDTSTTFADQISDYSTVRAERNGLFILSNSTLQFSTASAIHHGVLVCLQDSFPADPVAYDGGLVWYQKFEMQDSVFNDAFVPINGSAWITQGPAGHPVSFASYSVSYRRNGDPDFTPIVTDSTSEIRHNTLALWNTGGLTPGTYEVQLTIKSNFNDSLSILKEIVVLTNPNRIDELFDKQILVYPNPAENLVNITTGGERVEFVLYNLSGQAIETFSVNGRATINLQSGLYLLKATLNDRVVIRKLIIR